MPELPRQTNSHLTRKGNLMRHRIAIAIIIAALTGSASAAVGVNPVNRESSAWSLDRAPASHNTTTARSSWSTQTHTASVQQPTRSSWS